MGFLTALFIIVHIILSIGLVALVLLHSGKGRGTFRCVRRWNVYLEHDWIDRGRAKPGPAHRGGWCALRDQHFCSHLRLELNR